ncbi:PREDICTED: patched domain-containing protein 3-like, partial [Nanorana parkeri]|uniref:patched domain-containing protein 3-like n=1 Tax=Nanorana parkeri TaxID=125878 RepID=UPI0008544CBF
MAGEHSAARGTRELVKLDEMVQNLNITIKEDNDNVILNFQLLCAKVQRDECAAINPLLSKSAKAVRLVYYLREDNQQRSLQWIEHFIKNASQNIEILQLNTIKISYFSSISRQKEFEGTTKTVIPLYSITYFITIFFSVISCIRRDCVRNKTWVASFGVISAGLAILSSFGLLLLCGVPFVVTVASAPFLILSVGIDDMFIMVSSWQQTKVMSGVEERMGETYKEAAVSIIITTLTDVLAFYIGIMTFT